MGVMTVRELNANISQALARVEAGEILSITKNGRPIVEVRRPPARAIRRGMTPTRECRSG